ncbi:MAG: hypothetical protein HY204_12535 [Nitrospirae bacterium]|nr:hypothetical protein [Nitrospirota bacterium]
MTQKIRNGCGKIDRPGPICPHCRSGSKGNTLGLLWELREGCWRCVICGYRDYGQPILLRSKPISVA